MCRIDGCDREPTAKGLCAKHYMRLRRAGDPNHVRKSGPKPSENRSLLTPRARARFAQAMRTLEDAGGGAEEKLQAIRAARRPNGSLNVSKLLGIAIRRYIGAGYHIAVD
jgi:hypothetical protein